MRCTPIICARHSWVSGKLSLSVRSQAHNSQRDKRASTECEALQAAACWACAARRCSCRARRARRAALRSAAARRTAASRIEAVPDKRTAASVNAIPPSSAAETPKTLSRPTNATSTDLPKDEPPLKRWRSVAGRHMRQPGAGINQDRFPVQLHEFEMRTQRLKFSRRQGLQQMNGRTRARGHGLSDQKADRVRPPCQLRVLVCWMINAGSAW